LKLDYSTKLKIDSKEILKNVGVDYYIISDIASLTFECQIIAS